MSNIEVINFAARSESTDATNLGQVKEIILNFMYG